MTPVQLPARIGGGGVAILALLHKAQNLWRGCKDGWRRRHYTLRASAANQTHVLQPNRSVTKELVVMTKYAHNNNVGVLFVAGDGLALVRLKACCMSHMYMKMFKKLARLPQAGQPMAVVSRCPARTEGL